MKFTATDCAPVIKIRSERREDRWRISVADNGIGIARKNFDRIFQVFNRLNSKEQFDGVGIGLAHARRIMELHEGTIDVESTPDVGTTFRFELKGASE